MANYQKHKGRSSAALKHIEDAKRLTIELGGADQGVKKWFFSLTLAELAPILNKYRDIYGDKAYEYALKALPKWKSGDTKMSGDVTERLFSILPNFMPIDMKYELVYSLWKHFGIHKKRVVEAGVDSDIEQIIQIINDEVMSLATNWEIPDSLKKKFQWLSGHDAIIYQDIFSYIKESERKVAIAIMENQILLLKDNFSNNWQNVSKIGYVIELGKQSVELRIKSDSSGVVAKDFDCTSVKTLI